MNKAILVGRLTADPNYRKTQSGISQCSFSVAIDRPYSGPNGEKQTDFINCVAWRQSADFIHNYITKGRLVAVDGTIQTRSYDDQNGQKRYVTEVIVERIKPLTSANNSQGISQSNSQGYGQNRNQGYDQTNNYNSFNQTPNYNTMPAQPAQNEVSSANSNSDSQPFEDFTNDFDTSNNDLPF